MPGPNPPLPTPPAPQAPKPGTGIWLAGLAGVVIILLLLFPVAV